MLFVGIGTVCAEEENTLPGDTIMDNVDISLLTCQPHDEVYSLYGHTAIRVQNRNNGDDFAVNYGLFDFDSDNFVLRFVFGLTDYRMGLADFNRFLREYASYGSGVYQQRISMSREEKRAFLMALSDNAKPENVVYRYNYFYNNCTTKARDILLSALQGQVSYEETAIQKGERSFRDLIHLCNEAHPWAREGNDLLLGVDADRNTNHAERQFLPRVLMADFDSATVVGANGSVRPLVDTAYWVLQPGVQYQQTQTSALTSPATASLTFFCVIMALCLYQLVIRKRPMPWVSGGIVFLYGLLGIILGAMLFSKHPTVNFNLQILILNPLFLLLAFPKILRGWRWKIVLFFTLAFFAGNAIQSYAGGMNAVASALFILALTNLKFEKLSHTKEEK